MKNQNHYTLHPASPLFDALKNQPPISLDSYQYIYYDVIAGPIAALIQEAHAKKVTIITLPRTLPRAIAIHIASIAHLEKILVRQKTDRKGNVQKVIPVTYLCEQISLLRRQNFDQTFAGPKIPTIVALARDIQNNPDDYSPSHLHAVKGMVTILTSS